MFTLLIISLLKLLTYFLIGVAGVILLCAIIGIPILIYLVITAPELPYHD